MTDDSVKLTVYFGESDRTEGHLVSDRLLDVFEEGGVQAAALLRGVEGFGAAQRLRTDRFLTLSEDLPLVAIAVDERSRVEALLPRVTETIGGGLVTLERARLLRGGLEPVEFPAELHDAAKLTVYLGRAERVGDTPAYRAVVEHLRASGLAGATALLGVDGMAHGRRARARFLHPNTSVPTLVISIGSGESVASALPGLASMLENPMLTLERVRVCKRDGELLAEPRHLPERDDSGLGIWQKLMVYASEQARHSGHPLYLELIRRLRAEHAAGATSVRGFWGFSGDHTPHGDRLLGLRRRVPVVTTIVDTPVRIRRWFELVDECTDESGLVTSEMVPAFRETAPGRRVGGLRLARLR